MGHSHWRKLLASKGLKSGRARGLVHVSGGLSWEDSAVGAERGLRAASSLARLLSGRDVLKAGLSWNSCLEPKHGSSCHLDSLTAWPLIYARGTLLTIWRGRVSRGHAASLSSSFYWLRTSHRVSPSSSPGRGKVTLRKSWWDGR